VLLWCWGLFLVVRFWDVCGEPKGLGAFRSTGIDPGAITNRDHSRRMEWIYKIKLRLSLVVMAD
jgi:hypothetical protein